MNLDGGQDRAVDLWRWWGALAVGWVSLTGLCVWLWHHRDVCSFTWVNVTLLVVIAVAVRVVVVATSQPQLSDDVYRYIVDGQAVAHGDNPYATTPAQRVQALSKENNLAWPGEDKVVTSVNNPELYTLYLPASQWVFGFGAIVGNTVAGSVTQQIDVQRYVMSLIDIGVIILLLLAVWRHKRNIWWVALYAWHPLVVSEVAGSGHQEPIGLLFLVLALLLADAVPRTWWAWIAPLAVSVLVKPVTVFIAPVLLRRSPPLHWVAAFVLGVVICLVVASPFLFSGSEVFVNVWSAASRFTLKWAHFGSIYEPLLWLIEQIAPVGGVWTNDSQEQLARGLCVFVLLLIVVWVVIKALPIWSAARIILFAMVLLSPAAHPWYLLWPLVLMPIAPSAALWIASLTISFGYAALVHSGHWHVSWWVFVIAYVPVYVAILWGLVQAKPRPRIAASHSNV